MAFDPRDLHHPLRSCDAASAADHPSAAGDRKVKLLCSFGGQILPRLTDGALRYAGGETRIITVRRDSSLPEILRRMAEAYGGPVALRYQLPDEDLDALISVSTAEDLEHMMEECDKLAAQGSSVKLRVFLLSPSEGAGSGADPLSSFHDLQDTGARYIEAVNGLDSSIRRKDSVASFTSTQNSDVNEGMLTGHPSPTATSAQDASKLLFAAQDVQDLPSATTYDDQTQFLISTQLEPHPLVPNQDKILKLTQAELPSVVQPLTNLHHGQAMNSQSYTVTGLPSEVSFVSAAQPAYLSPSHDGAPAALDGNGASVPAVMDMHLKNPNGGKIAKFPGDAKLQPLSQLPPLPPPHLLAPNVDRHGLRQLPPLTQKHGLEDCSLCQRALPHAHSDTVIKEQGSGLRDAIPGANAVLQSHLSEDFTRTRAPQTVDTRTPVDKWVESQAQNLLASDPLVTYEFSETFPEMSLGTERSVVQDAAYPVRTKVLVSPYSLGWPDTSEVMYGTITNPQKSILEDSMLKPGEVSLTWNPNAENLDHSNILLTPASLALPSNPYGTSTIIPQSQSQDTLHQQVQSAQHVGYSKFLGNQVPISKPYVADGSSVENSEFQDGQSIRGTGPAFSCGYIRPMDEIMGALCTNPPGAHGFSNWPRHVGASKDLKPDQQPLVKVNTHNTGPEDKGNELSLSNPLLTEQPTALGEVSYLQSVQPANSSHIPSVAGSHGSQSCHLEAGVEPKRISNHEDLVYNNSTFNNEASNFLPVELLSDLNISKTIRTLEVGSSASALESSEIPVPNLISHETKETKPQSNKDISSIKISVEIDDDQTETIKTKQSEKVKNNGFPNTDDIEHLQVIKNSDLEELQELGSGAFGTVYYGKWRGTDVAIKRINDRVFSEKPSEQERARADFWNEARKLASLHHPNVVAFYGIVLDGPAGSIATLTEFMVNGSLRRVLQKNEKILDKWLCLLIAMDVAFGMEYLHSRNIIHFDLKSDNLLVNWRDPQRPICKVGDLGLAKVKYETLMSGGMRGTLPWMAPELLSGKENKYTEKVDVFSFGIVMWELTTGKEPYGDMHYGAIIGGILGDTLRPPVPESCDDEWRSLMKQCWATEPSQRPSFTEIASRLRAMAASLPQKS